jgi:hypothetical protein
MLKNTDDCRLLAEQVWPDRCWHEFTGAEKIDLFLRYECSCGRWIAEPGRDAHLSLNPTFCTPSEREELLQWAMGREWWSRFYASLYVAHVATDCMAGGFARWLLSAPDYRFVNLILDYGRKVLGWKLKGG